MNPRINLAHCFACEEIFNNIDLLIALGYDFLAAVELLEQWLQTHGERCAVRSTLPASRPIQCPVAHTGRIPAIGVTLGHCADRKRDPMGTFRLIFSKILNNSVKCPKSLQS